MPSSSLRLVLWVNENQMGLVSGCATDQWAEWGIDFRIFAADQIDRWCTRARFLPARYFAADKKVADVAWVSGVLR